MLDKSAKSRQRNEPPKPQIQCKFIQACLKAAGRQHSEHTIESCPGLVDHIKANSTRPNREKHNKHDSCIPRQQNERSTVWRHHEGYHSHFINVGMIDTVHESCHLEEEKHGISAWHLEVHTETNQWKETWKGTSQGDPPWPSTHLPHKELQWKHPFFKPWSSEKFIQWNIMGYRWCRDHNTYRVLDSIARIRNM